MDLVTRKISWAKSSPYNSNRINKIGSRELPEIQILSIIISKLKERIALKSNLWIFLIIQYTVQYWRRFKLGFIIIEGSWRCNFLFEFVYEIFQLKSKIFEKLRLTRTFWNKKIFLSLKTGIPTFKNLACNRSKKLKGYP